MDILADSPLIPASFFLDSMSSTHPPPKAGSCTFMPFWSLFSALWLCCAWLSFSLRMPLSEQGIWQRRGLFLGRFLSIFILGFRVLSSFSFRCSWYLVATVSCCGRSLLVHSSGVTFCLSRHLLLFVLVCCLDAFPLPHEDCTAFFCFALLCTSLMLFGGLIRSRGG